MQFDRQADDTLTQDELFFFDGKPDALALYKTFRTAVLAAVPEARIEVKWTQISFFARRMFACVSFTPVRRAKDRPAAFITVSFGLACRLDSSRIDDAVEAAPLRWTHHVLIGDAAQIDSELIAWISESAAFAAAKR